MERNHLATSANILMRANHAGLLTAELSDEISNSAEAFKTRSIELTAAMNQTFKDSTDGTPNATVTQHAMRVLIVKGWAK
ncbi:hypothetical protein [Gilvimarinus japonicus]|uniref:Uncharacterized protein n=1 Tax=Gilvimarinus japonicus TaxID=1796469 RepID=A0ABV7HRE3_9GAMM